MSETQAIEHDELLYGWDPLPGIVSVWANRSGRAVVWRRDGEQVLAESGTFRPWVFARTLDDLDALDAATEAYELDGEPGSYRWLISARPNYRLERAIVDAASRRLGRELRTLGELDDYVGVGPVEQYLMATGRASFRGLAYDDLHRLQFDLETTALDAERGRIFMVSLSDTHGLATTLEAPRAEDEAGLIRELCRTIRLRDPDVIENHNLFGFDLPFLLRRAELLHVPIALARPAPQGITLPPLEHYNDPYSRGPAERRRKRPSIPGRELVDTLDAVRRYDFAARDLPSHRLKEVAVHFGIAAPERVYLPGAEVYQTYLRDPELVRRYAQDDVAEVRALSERLLGAPFALAGMAPRRYERLASAGPAMGILEPMLIRAYLHSGAALPAPAEEGGLAPHAGGKLELFAAGVAEHVVKADVASLYPSIMRTFGIGPASDRLGALLHIMSRLTELRLMHKAAARTAEPGSTEAGIHHGSQAAMKVLINSAYGYMGAGSMALWADRRAADEVTRRGRALLDRVVDELRGCGVALIEADTDGVFFAVPPSWDEERERALVASVAATLPDGIRLEYEGRYRAMFSHEVKNYAILSYDQELVVRGVALRSSRAEPYGERFLRQGLRCLLEGNVSALHREFIATVSALRERSLTAVDVATRVRLAKTPDAYNTSRMRQREQQYEALLNAGRTQWPVGERVRVFRAQDGSPVWLPEADDDMPAAVAREQVAELEQRTDYDVEHYVQVLLTSYAGRFRKAFAPYDWEQLFRLDGQTSMFDRPLESIEPLWIRCVEAG